MCYRSKNAAVIQWDEEGRKRMEEYHDTNGELSRPHKKGAAVTEWDANGRICIKKYCRHGVFHRPWKYGASFLSYWGNGNKMQEKLQ